MKYLITFLCVLIAINIQGQTVYKTPNGTKYHQLNCRTIKNVKESISLADAQKLNLKACLVCKPDRYLKSKDELNEASKDASNELLKAVQCAGFTNKGIRCKHKTRNKNGYCYQHNP